MNTLHAKLLQSYVQKYASLDQDDIDALVSLFEFKKYKLGDHIVFTNEYNNTTFFILSGLVRYYYLTDDGKEWNRAFLCENMMSTSFSENSAPIESYAIQTIEETELLFADFSRFQELFDCHPMIERLHRKLIEEILILKLNRERSFLQRSAKMRYLDFVNQFPDLFQRVTQYHLASYLGITEASLSRIVKEIG